MKARIAAAALASSLGAPAFAMETSAVNGGLLSPIWVLPFVGILLSIALVPLTAPHFWHRHYGKTSAFWALAFVVPFAGQFGVEQALHEIAHTLLAEYVPFIVLLLALFTVAGGIHIRSTLRSTPALNTAILALGTMLASVMGTTGASMLLIRPLLSANAGRRHKAHVVVFFIFLVANIGGALTPLGDPPLFLGFLKGVDFFWTTKAMIGPTVTAASILLALFYLIDRWYFSRPGEMLHPHADVDLHGARFSIQGGFNFVLLFAILLCVLVSGVWQPGIEFNVIGTAIPLQGLLRDVGLLAITWISWRQTPRSIRAAHHFEWGPIVEVAKLFAAIFLTIIPAIAILRAGQNGILSPLFALVSHADGRPDNLVFFWLTGILSSVLDNAPTYLVFFNLAGGNPRELMGALAFTLTAISAGAVYMGALTYIGNAPNLMVRSIAQARGVEMPSFIGYIVWSALILMPLLALISFLHFQ